MYVSHLMARVVWFGKEEFAASLERLDMLKIAQTYTQMCTHTYTQTQSHKVTHSQSPSSLLECLCVFLTCGSAARYALRDARVQR